MKDGVMVLYGGMSSGNEIVFPHSTPIPQHAARLSMATDYQYMANFIVLIQ
jgi:hypothetical protein